MTQCKNIVILLNFNDALVTGQLAEKLSRYERLHRILIVDNASTDHSVEALRLIANDKIEVITSDKNGGYAYGNNIGLRFAERTDQPNIYMIANPDIDISNEAVNECLDFLEKSPMDIACVAPTMKMLNGSMNTAWKSPTFGWMCLTALIPLRPLLNRWIAYPKSDRLSDVTFVDVLAGSLFFVKASAIHDVEYFDERTFLFGEENILAYKLKKAGYRSALLNHIEYLHLHSQTINKSITNVKKKFLIALDSDLIYLNEYLKVSSIQLSLYISLYRIGIFMFVLLKRLQGFVK